MGNEAEPRGRPRRLGMLVAAVAMVVPVDVLVNVAAGAGEEGAARDDSASDVLPLSASV